MATLDDKLLGEKLEYYCSSSSDDEQENTKVISDAEACSLPNNKTYFSQQRGVSTNTGPKGVVQDWMLFKKLEAEKREENEKQKLELAKKLSMTVPSSREDEKRKQDELLDAELDELLNDEVLLEFQRKRMEEMLKASGQYKEFGRVLELKTSTEFLDEIEKEHKNQIVIIHVYNTKLSSCQNVNKCLLTLAVTYKNIKFCKILCSVTGMSCNFQEKGLPALLVYKAGQLIGNYVQITKELGDDFFPSDLESFLVENGILFEKLNLTN